MYWYFAIALFGAAMTPYEVFFFSSGAVEEHWTKKDLGTSRLAQFLGWPWGKFRRPAEAARFHVVMFVAIVVGAAVLYTGVDPIMVTEYSVVFSAIALPLTYLPILIVANDSEYMGDDTNGRVTNMLASVYLVIILVASLAAIPLMIVTGAGQ
jgi:Mn2+/Fe2+ NRAMP family transporter